MVSRVHLSRCCEMFWQDPNLDQSSSGDTDICSMGTVHQSLWLDLTSSILCGAGGKLGWAGKGVWWETCFIFGPMGGYWGFYQGKSVGGFTVGQWHSVRGSFVSLGQEVLSSELIEQICACNEHCKAHKCDCGVGHVVHGFQAGKTPSTKSTMIDTMKRKASVPATIDEVWSAHSII